MRPPFLLKATRRVHCCSVWRPSTTSNSSFFPEGSTLSHHWADSMKTALSTVEWAASWAGTGKPLVLFPCAELGCMSDPWEPRERGVTVGKSHRMWSSHGLLGWEPPCHASITYLLSPGVSLLLQSLKCWLPGQGSAFLQTFFCFLHQEILGLHDTNTLVAQTVWSNPGRG